MNKITKKDKEFVLNIEQEVNSCIKNSSNIKLYTEEDLIKVWVAGMRFIGEDKGSYKEIIQSLQKPKLPVVFDCEENIFLATNAFCTDVSLTADGLKDTILRSPKTTTNSQGITQWVGSYIYE
jgi:hypothetical protein